jgi:hypothetical protein
MRPTDAFAGCAVERAWRSGAATDTVLAVKRIVGGILVAVALLVPAGAGAETPPGAAMPPPMENLWPPLEVSFPLQMTLEANPLEFRCQTWGKVTPLDYMWRISTSPATEAEGLLAAGDVVASGGTRVIDEAYGQCGAVPSAQRLAPGDYYWQVARPKEPGPGVEVGPVGTFTVGQSRQCRAMAPILAKAKRKVTEDEKRLRAARDPKAKRKIRERLIGRKIDVIRVTHNRTFFCHAGAGGR